MARSRDATQVGLFVLAALFIGLATAIFVGSLRLFSDQATFLLYFNESVNGLTVGAPVKYKGVPIGKVSDIKIRFNQSIRSSAIPVFVEIDTGRLQSDFGVSSDITDEEELAEQIREGLRARLQLDSFISGLLFIELDYVEDKRQYPAIFYQEEIQHLEIPTIPSAMARLGTETSDIFAQISAIDFEAISDQVSSLLSTVNQTVEEFEVAEAQEAFTTAANNFSRLVESGELEKTLGQARSMMGSIEELTANIDRHAGELGKDIDELKGSLRLTLAEGRETLNQLNTILDPESTSRRSVEDLLRELSRLSRQLRQFVSFIEQYPNAFIGGREGTEYAAP